MPKKKIKKPIKRSSNSDTQVTFTFFNSKLFISLIAIALIVIAFAVLSAINNTYTGSENYRIDTTNLQNDPSANQFVKP